MALEIHVTLLGKEVPISELKTIPAWMFSDAFNHSMENFTKYNLSRNLDFQDEQ